MAGVFAVLICFVGYLVQRGYRLGIVEAIATTIFIGFACDYCVHIAQVHASMRHASVAEQRGGGGGGGGAERLTRTLVHAGPSLYGAALTTVGAALPLLFCYVVVFHLPEEPLNHSSAFERFESLNLCPPSDAGLPADGRVHLGLHLLLLRGRPHPHRPRHLRRR